ncbi:hypothetical protein P3X46_019244 [Hevea brasiliensis]|uniref:Uncharacterized protein n=1 Tax=Hevea brasiliensis TaxID=3981 RepID=A0ABQ9LI24_HEVBR|nr:hypothetical protein P3X46_019244 [Hevea brasiliensis]
MHGDLDTFYQTIQHMGKLNGIKIYLLLCCSDFQIRERTLGIESKAAAQPLEKLRLPYLFCANLHCKLAALIQHGESGPLTKFLALESVFQGSNFWSGTQDC